MIHYYDGTVLAGKIVGDEAEAKALGRWNYSVNEEMMSLLIDVLEKVQPNELTVLCGAGVSRPAPTSLPTVYDFLVACLTHSNHFEKHYPAFESRLNETPSPRFEVLIDRLRRIRDKNMDVARVFDSLTSNRIHQYLHQLCDCGATILTTNFDNCIERAGSSDLRRVVFNGVDLDAEPPMNRTIFKPHGSNPLHDAERADGLVISIRALSRTAGGFQQFPVWRECLLALIRERILFVVGYSGSDDFDINPVLLDSDPREILWLDYRPDFGAAREIDEDIAYERVRHFLSPHKTRFFAGEFDPPIHTQEPNTRHESLTRSNRPLTTNDWLYRVFSSEAAKRELFATLALHHNLPDAALEELSPVNTKRESVLRGRSLFFLGRHADAVKQLTDRPSKEEDKLFYADSHYISSACNSYLGNHSIAIDEAREFCNVIETIDDTDEMIAALNNLGGVCCFATKYGESREAFERALAMMKKSPSIEGEATAKWGLADIEGVEGNWHRAYENYTTARDRFVQLGGVYPVAWLEHSIGNALLHLRRFSEAELALSRAEEIFSQRNRADGLAFVFFVRVKIEYLNGHISRACDHITQVLKQVQRNHKFPIVPNLLNLAAVIEKDAPNTRALRDAVSWFGDSLKGYSHQSGIASKDAALLIEVIENMGSVSEQLYLRLKEHLFGTVVPKKM